jgi:excinuclease ABC subunit C
MSAQPPPFDTGAFLETLTHRPGVYRMLDAEGRLLYVGKAKDLKRRVSTYFRASGLGLRNRSMMERTHHVEVTVTRTESEALLLEHNLIKRHRPRYNVLLRDDKSYPYIHVATEQPYPRLAFHRGTRRAKGRYFGPYPSAAAVRETLNLLQKLFRVRQCEDSFFRNRARPCLQYQINRCTAPCVGRITMDSYREDVDHTIRFLEGRSEEVARTLIGRMEAAAQGLDFERAADYRDQIEALRRVTERQYVSGEHGDLDIVAVGVAQDVACVQVFNIRAGLNLGNASFFPELPGEMGAAELITAFLGQYYLGREAPERIIASHRPADLEALGEALSRRAGHPVTIAHAVRGERARWLELANRNVAQGVNARLASKAGYLQRLSAMQEALGLEFLPRRMECFDISHTLGEATVGACVVFDESGPLKSAYRRFNITDIEPGDDYGALRQALSRRYRRLKQGEGKLPDILFIDGGRGQLRQAEAVLEELQIEGVLTVGVAKGPGRRPGLEAILLGTRTVALTPHSSALHLIQQIRDEAHRFAITGHRQRRGKARSQSPLERIPGLGPKRRQSLLKHFGGMRGVGRAGVEELCKVPGISAKLAHTIYDALHAQVD